MVTRDVDVAHVLDRCLLDRRCQLLLKWSLVDWLLQIGGVFEEDWVLVGVNVPDESISRIVVIDLLVDFQVVLWRWEADDLVLGEQLALGLASLLVGFFVLVNIWRVVGLDVAVDVHELVALDEVAGGRATELVEFDVLVVHASGRRLHALVLLGHVSFFTQTLVLHLGALLPLRAFLGHIFGS